MAVTTKKTFPATTNATTTVFSPVGIQLNNQDDLDVYVTLSGGTRVLQLRQATASTAQSSHPQVNNTDGLYFPAVSAGTNLINYTLSSDNNTITFNSALPSGAVVFCERRTRDADSAYTSFASGSTIRATDLNNSSTESNFTAQDARNKALDLEGSIFGGVQPTIDGVAQPFVTSAKIIDGSITTADVADNSITTAKIVDGNITHAKIQDNAVITAKIADGNVTSAKIATGSVTTAKLAADSVTNAKIADDSIDSEHYVDGSIDTAHIGNLQVTTAKIAADAVDGTKIADDSIDSEHYVNGSIDTAHIGNLQVTASKIASNAVTTDKIADGELTTLAGMQSTTASNLASSTALTATTAELNQLDGITLETSVTTNSDTHIPTSKAVNDLVLSVVNAVGGFVAIANETSFPTANPDPSNNAGTVVSISQLASSLAVNSSGVATITNGAGTGNTVTITGFPSSLVSQTLPASSGLQVQTTSTLHTYTFHKQLASAADIQAISATVNSFSNRYRVSASAPTSSLDGGDLWYDTTNSKLMVYSSQNSAWEESSAIGNFFIATISSSSSTGGGSATANGTAYRFTISNAPVSAQQLIVSVDGVIQKPNAGSSQPSEGFVLVGNDIIFGSAPANGASMFVTVIGSTVGIGTPSDNTVTTAILQNGSVTTPKIADASVTTAKIADGAVTMQKLGTFTQTGTGATARTVDSKLKDVISVKDFGATGDGSTNDATAINTALLAATGKTLYFPAGTYIIGAELQPKTGTTIIGDGIQSTIIKASNSLATNTTLINIVDGQDAVTIKDLRVDGNESNRSSGSGGSNNIMIMSNRNILERVSTIEAENAGILFGSTSDASEENTVNNCIIEDNNGVGLSQSNCSGTIITNNRFARNGLENLTIDANSNRTICTNNRFFKHFGGVGNIGWDDSVDSKICDNFIDNQSDTTATAANRNGICVNNEIAGTDPTTHRCMISNNHIVNYKNNGIWLKDTDDSVSTVEDAGAFIISNNFLARAASPESGSTDIKIGKTTFKIIIEGNNAEDIDVDDATLTSVWGFSSDVQVGSTKHTVIDQFTDTDRANDRLEPSVFVSATYDGGNLTGDQSAPLGIYAQHELKGATSTNAYTHSIMGYGLNNSAGDNDAIGTSGRARKLDVTNGVGDAAGIWGSAYQESTKDGGVMGAETSIYQNVAGTAATDRLGAKWSASLHVNSDSTGSRAIAGIGIDSTGNSSNSVRHGYWNAIIIDANTFSSNGASAGTAGTVGLNCGSWGDTFGYPEYGIKIGKSKYTLSLGDLPTDGYHLYKPNGDIKINANQTFFESANNSGLILDCGKGPTSGDQLDYIDFKINGGLKGNIVCREDVTGHPIQINSNNNSTGGVELYHGNGTTSTKRIETTSSGVTVNGTCTATAFAGDGSALTGIAGIPTGVIVLWSGAANAIPSGYVLCDGNNSTPDLRDRFIVGAGSTYNVAATGGSATVSLTEAQMPSHVHHVYIATDSSGPYGHAYASGNNNTQGAIATTSKGSGSAHENRPPYYALCYIMKT